MSVDSILEKDPGAISSTRRDYHVNVLDRAIAILRAFNATDADLSLAEISRRTGLHRSTALRLLSTLTRNGLLVRNESTGRYSLGYELIALAETAKAGTGLVEWARPVMRQMRAMLDETFVISVRSGDQRVDLDQVVGQQPLRRIVELGKRKPLTVGAPSLCILSGLPPSEVDGLCAQPVQNEYGEDIAIDREELWRRIGDVRELGYAEHMSNAKTIGSAGLAVPVRDSRGRVVAALGASIPLARYAPALRDELIGILLSGAETLSAQLGQRRRAA